jgi:hypothetical protein
MCAVPWMALGACKGCVDCFQSMLFSNITVEIASTLNLDVGALCRGVTSYLILHVL